MWVMLHKNMKIVFVEYDIEIWYIMNIFRGTKYFVFQLTNLVDESKSWWSMIFVVLDSNINLERCWLATKILSLICTIYQSISFFAKPKHTRERDHIKLKTTFNTCLCSPKSNWNTKTKFSVKSITVCKIILQVLF